VHILTPSATVRRFVNISALAVTQAIGQRGSAAEAAQPRSDGLAEAGGVEE
jgi:hypothetical protein